jgi:calcineurin-like phosphoesterase family protein
MIYFTADTHLGHANIIKYCDRPFRDVNEMDDAIIDNINSCVNKDDILYHLGDFAFSSNIGRYRQRILCRQIHLIRGNHDRYNNCKGHFSTIQEYLSVGLKEGTFVLFHYPIAVWDRAHYNTIHLFGHSHGTHTPWREEHMPNSLSMDVGIDANKFMPLSVDEIVNIMEERKRLKQVSIDHHKKG